MSDTRTFGEGRAESSGEHLDLSISDSARSSRSTIRLKKRAAWAPAITRRSKLRVSANVGHATIAPPRTTGRGLASPNETPSGCVHVPATTSTPYLAGELTRTAPPRYLHQRLGDQAGQADQQRGEPGRQPGDQGAEFTPLLVGGRIADRQVMEGRRDLRQGEPVGIAKDVQECDRLGARDVALAGDGHVAVMELLQARTREGEPGPPAHAAVRVGEIAQGQGHGLDDERRVGRPSFPGRAGLAHVRLPSGPPRRGTMTVLPGRISYSAIARIASKYLFFGSTRRWRPSRDSSCRRSCGTFGSDGAGDRPCTGDPATGDVVE